MVRPGYTGERIKMSSMIDAREILNAKSEVPLPEKQLWGGVFSRLISDAYDPQLLCSQSEHAQAMAMIFADEGENLQAFEFILKQVFPLGSIASVKQQIRSAVKKKIYERKLKRASEVSLSPALNSQVGI